MDVVLSKSRLRPLLFVPMSLVVLGGVIVEVLKPLYKLPSRSGIVPFLSMSYEGNVPTFYTASLLGFTSLLLALAAAATKRAGERFVAHWWGLSAGFAYIAVDEVFEFHEMAGTFVELTGVLYFSWVIPAAVVVLLVGLAYIPFLRHLPLKTRIRFLAAGAIYVGGAVGMELPLGYWTEQNGTHNLGYGLIDAVEESLEMLGLNLFVLWLVDHLAEKGVTLRFANPAPAPAPEGEAEATE
ncbi:hypothetical protein [Polyangium jinanense]|uniref:Uncharacterized protein n=1 Tax=Polyangium jinanense TaxID=2829994 RepID=A0A9X3XBR8_9BACT|nr:hypothetical protein [Polyangium jinanense]MDC3957534.1 hypothetical protein [Polyangium jinanense]MDC3984976.1 hypothetical protein [Polyangium jinanense]